MVAEGYLDSNQLDALPTAVEQYPAPDGVFHNVPASSAANMPLSFLQLLGVLAVTGLALATLQIGIVIVEMQPSKQRSNALLRPH